MAELAALAASAALAAMLFASRLPPDDGFLLPRRGGYLLFRAAWALLSTPEGRGAFSAAVVLVLLAAAFTLATRLKRDGSPWKGLPPRVLLGRALGPAFAAALAARGVLRGLDLIQLAWFTYAGADAREPLAAFALFSAALVPAAAAAREWVAGRRRAATVLLAGLVLLDAAGGVLSRVEGVGRPLEVPAARGTTRYVVPDGGRGESAVYVLAPDIFSDPDPRPALVAVASARRDARSLPALRSLYEEQAKRWDIPGLRSALLLGVRRGDPLAPILLLAHLSSAAPFPEASAALATLTDETAWRVGPRGAAALSRACSRQGDRAGAQSWAERAGGPAGIAPGLLARPAGGALKPGRISGVLRAPVRAKIALYAREDPSAPRLLGAAGLVASADPDARGRFSFSGLPAGRYYLAVALSAADAPRGEVSASGATGDLILDARRPSLDLPPLTIKLTER